MSWRTVSEADLAATISQGEIEAYRADSPLDGSDPVEVLINRTVATTRNWIACNGSIRLGPVATLPEGLISPAMDYAAADLLKRMNVELNEDRRRAREKAEQLFEKIATGALTCESYGDESGESRAASAPAFAPPTPERLLD